MPAPSKSQIITPAFHVIIQICRIVIQARHRPKSGIDQLRDSLCVLNFVGDQQVVFVAEKRFLGSA